MKLTAQFSSSFSHRVYYLTVYLDDNAITGSDDHQGIAQVKHICHHFHTKDLGSCLILEDRSGTIHKWYFDFPNEVCDGHPRGNRIDVCLILLCIKFGAIYTA